MDEKVIMKGIDPVLRQSPEAIRIRRKTSLDFLNRKISNAPEATNRSSPEMGALPNAPKKAPAWRTDTTLEETSLAFLVLGVPSGFKRPKCSLKYFMDTTPPPIPLSQVSLSACMQ